MLSSQAGTLLVFALMIGVSACTSRPVISASPTSTSTLATATPAATRQPPTGTPTPTAFVPPLPDDKRILASNMVGNAPWNMTLGDGSLWVIAGISIVRIDPQTSQVVGMPSHVELPEKASLEAVVVEGDSLWVSMARELYMDTISIRYVTLPELSVEGFQANVTLVAVMTVVCRLVGVVGAVRSLAARTGDGPSSNVSTINTATARAFNVRMYRLFIFLLFNEASDIDTIRW